MKAVPAEVKELRILRAKALKDELKVTFKEWAKETYLSESTLRNYAERGECSTATAETIAKHYGKIVPYWLGETNLTSAVDYEIEKERKRKERENAEAQADGEMRMHLEDRKKKNRLINTFAFLGFDYSINEIVADFYGIDGADWSDVTPPCLLVSKNNPSIQAHFTLEEIRDIINNVSCAIELECYKKMAKENKAAASSAKKKPPAPSSEKK